MLKNILRVLVIMILFAGQSFAQAGNEAKDAAEVQRARQDDEERKRAKALEQVSREELLARLNMILERNPKILEAVPSIKREMSGTVPVFFAKGKALESLSKEELVSVLRLINPVLRKIQQEKLNKQIEQTIKANEQNMQIQRAAQQQSQMKAPASYTPPSVYTPPTKQQMPPSTPPAPPRR